MGEFKFKRASWLLIFALLIPAGLFGLPKKVFAQEKSVEISEVVWMGTTISANDEWMELKNLSEKTVNLSGWKIKARDGQPDIILSGRICPGKYFLLERTDDETVPGISANQIYTGALGNNGETIELINNDALIIDSILMENGWQAGNNTTKQTMERNENGEWQNSIAPGGTPEGDDNCPAEDPEPEPDPEPIIYFNQIIINELLPNPESGEEFIEFFNTSEKKVDLSGWILRDGSKSGKYVFPVNTFLEGENYLVLYKKDFKFALNNSGAESVTLFDLSGNEIFTANYVGSKKGASFNFDGINWRWSKLLTPGAANVFNNLPAVSAKKKNKIYVDVYAQFSASGEDADEDNLKYTWDFGDGHKSYLKNTRHKFEKPGKYKVSLKVSDGSEDVFEHFDIEVRKYPRSKVRIVSLSPNPKGRDSDLETITVKNDSKKKINLKNWSVATGTKKLINHPITVDLEIKPKKTAAITRAHSKFTLGNKAAKIELRYPDSEAADKVKYKLEKTIAEGEIYQKDGKKWQWVKAQSNTNLPRIEADTISDNNTGNIETIPDEEIIENEIDAEIPEDLLGKYSENPEWRKKKENKIVLASFNSKIKLPENLPASPGRVLGAATVRAENNFYAFTPPAAPQKHWVINFMENLLLIANSSINKLFF